MAGMAMAMARAEAEKWGNARIGLSILVALRDCAYVDSQQHKGFSAGQLLADIG